MRKQFRPLDHSLKASDFETPRQRVFMVADNDGAIVLDVSGLTQQGRTGRLIKFDGIGAEIWKLLCSGNSHSEVVDHILSEYSVDRETVERDLSNLLRDTEALGLKPDGVFLNEVRDAEPGEQLPSFPWYAQDSNAPRPAPSRFMVFSAFIGLCVFDFLLSAVSMEAMCNTVRRCPVKRRKAAQDGMELMGKICTAVDRSCVWYRKKALCLQRSAVTSCMLKAWGIAAEMVLAARPMPVMAHAWVEVSHAVVNDRPTVRKFYRTLARY
ncbi:MAG TPA: lasso peptide biosynthesis B2 protein [Candidatus Saccharimonadales bacterium]|jgi:hypothetical protein|nr:lasso peptide biosynthesis B2 protein [Candidatus Saccharimonadales bacterium]